jgi:hypothetical protein
MTKVTELSFISNASNATTSFIVVDNKITRRISFNSLLIQLRSEIGRADQQLFTTSSVTFANITATNQLVASNISATTLSLVSGAVVNKMSIGNQPLNTFSANLFVSNYTANERSTIILRGYRDNFPSPISFFSRPDFHAEYSRGSSSTVSAVLNGDTLGGFSVGGYDGSKWSSDRDFNSGELIFKAAENWSGNITTATNAGTTWYLRSQIPGVPLASPTAGYNQTHIYQYWTAYGTSTIISSNLGFGGGSDGSNPTVRKSDGTSYLGYGSTNLYFVNSKFNIYGTVREDSAPDNESLPDSSKITLVGNRGSGVFARRRAVIANDTLGRLEFHGNDGSSTISSGSHGGELAYRALENFSTVARGTKILLTSINSGTITETNRLELKNLENIYSSDSHKFKSANNNNNFVTITSSSFIVSSVRAVKGTIPAGFSPMYYNTLTGEVIVVY